MTMTVNPTKPYLDRHGCLYVPYGGTCIKFHPDVADLPGAYPVLLDAVAHLIGFRDPGNPNIKRRPRGTLPRGKKASDFYPIARQQLYWLGVHEGIDGRLGFRDILPRLD